MSNVGGMIENGFRGFVREIIRENRNSNKTNSANAVDGVADLWRRVSIQ
jgi:hypothetical protein